MRIQISLENKSRNVLKNGLVNMGPGFLTILQERAFENILGKGENADHQHFLLFPKCFFTIRKTHFNFLVTFTLLSAYALNLDWSEMLFGKELTHYQTKKL